MQRLLLILPSATYRAPDFMAARELGVAVTVASDRAAAMSAAMGERALTLRSSDPRAPAEVIIARAHDTPFAAIVGVDDQGVMTAALAAERLGLPHNPPLAVARTRDKAAMRWAFASARADRDERPRRTRLPGFARGRSPAESKRIGRRCAVSSLGGRPTEQSSGVDKAACGRGLGSRDSCGAPLWISM